MPVQIYTHRIEFEIFAYRQQWNHHTYKVIQQDVYSLRDQIRCCYTRNNMDIWYLCTFYPFSVSSITGYLKLRHVLKVVFTRMFNLHLILKDEFYAVNVKNIETWNRQIKIQFSSYQLCLYDIHTFLWLCFHLVNCKCQGQINWKVLIQTACAWKCHVPLLNE